MNIERETELSTAFRLYTKAIADRMKAQDENRKLKQEAALYIQGKSSELRQMVGEYLEDEPKWLGNMSNNELCAGREDAK